MKLTNSQKAIVDKLRKGYEIRWVWRYQRYELYDADSDYTKTVNIRTFIKLKESGLLEQRGADVWGLVEEALECD